MAKNIYIVLISLCATKIFSNAAETGSSNGRTSNGIHNHIGFMGSRGKRDTSHVENEQTRRLDESTFEEDSTIHPLLFKDTGNLIEKETNDRTDKDIYLRNLPQLSIFKRTPPGFMGMRGKKDYEYSDYSRSDEYDFDPESPRTKKVFLQGINRGLLFNSVIPKRAPSGFVGMRGKKAFDNYKRVIPTSGFYGVRGKKSNLDAALIYDQLENLLQSGPEFYDNYEQTKRDQKQGFYGMRGRRFPNEYYSDFHDNSEMYEKRAPTGFMGMRGRRYFDDAGDGDGGYDEDVFYETVKRQPSGFFGMRGKKDIVNEQLPSEERQLEKRAALAQFFGTRGKKQPFNSGFFGMRGKKQPFEFRGKFVGVRGKKDGQQQDNSLHRLESELNDFPENIKRTPVGFMGMRGKKVSESDTTKE